MRDRARLLGLLLSVGSGLWAACGSLNPPWQDVLALYARGQYPAVADLCLKQVRKQEEALAQPQKHRLEAADILLQQTVAGDFPLLAPDERLSPGPDETYPAPQAPLPLADERGLLAARGAALQQLGVDLLSPSPSRIFRAIYEMEQLRLHPLVPRCIVRIYESVAVDPETTGPFAGLDRETLTSLIRRRCALAVRTALDQETP